MGEATSFGPVIYGEILQSGYSVRLGWGEGKPSSWAGGGATGPILPAIVLAFRLTPILFFCSDQSRRAKI